MENNEKDIKRKKKNKLKIPTTRHDQGRLVRLQPVHDQRKQFALKSGSFQEFLVNISFIIHINTFVFHPIQAGKSLESFENRKFYGSKVIYIFKEFLYLLCRKQTVEGCGKSSDVHKYLMCPVDFLAFERFGSSRYHPQVQQTAERTSRTNLKPTVLMVLVLLSSQFPLMKGCTLKSDNHGASEHEADSRRAPHVDLPAVLYSGIPGSTDFFPESCVRISIVYCQPKKRT